MCDLEKYMYINLCCSLFANDNKSLREPIQYGMSANEGPVVFQR
jgi:hypothetical protein